MRFLFKASIAVLGASAVAGQSWMHEPAGPRALAEVARISRKCPSLAIEAGRGRTSRLDVVLMRDAWWRARIAAAIVGEDGCRVRGRAKDA